jgi:NADH-quinone oxidoreductase subunit L
VETLVFLLILFPALGGALQAIGGGSLSRRTAEIMACLSIFGAMCMAATAFFMVDQKSYTLTFFNWIVVGEFSATFTVHFDPLAAIMALMVTFVSFMIHLYSISFMRRDPDYVRYFCYLNLFVFSMLVITLSDNIVFLYLGWEGVGFCSYALIGFWYSDEVKATAGRKAFVVTRIGDVAFGIAIALLFATLGSFSLSYVNSHAAGISHNLAMVLGLLLLWAAVGKSAQLPLTVWLPDAMAGPTPVSALIHAATMVTAGVYLLMRFFPVLLLSPTTLLIIAVVGAVTAFYSACAALGQKDIKRVLAYSTISQVSYMFLAVGAGDIVGGMFLLLSHAFYKALLFLSAGCVIQALDEEHDIFRMGNLRRLLPMVYLLFLIGALSLSAFPPFGGYFSKDRILMATFLHPQTIFKVLWGLAAAGALLTPLYTMRLFFVAFSNRPNGRREVTSIPKFMQLVLWPLAILALCDGFLNLPSGPAKHWLARFLSVVPGAVVDLGAPSDLAWTMAVGDAILVMCVVVLAYFLYRPGRKFLGMPTPVGWGTRLGELLFSAFHLDRLYEWALARPYAFLSDVLWMRVDEGIVDASFDATGSIFSSFSRGLRLWTNGSLTYYLKMLLLGFTILLCILGLSWYWM